MRTLFSLLFAFTVACAACSKVETPEVVKAEFEKKYPHAEGVSWSTDRNDMQEAHFKLEGEKYRADFMPEGRWIETEQSVGWSDLPGDVKGTYKARTGCNKYDIIEIEKVDHHERGDYYDIEYKHKGKKKEIGIRPNGEVLPEE